MTLILNKLAKIRQQKREYYYRNRDKIRYNQKLYQSSIIGKSNIQKAKAKYFQSKIKKANGGCETDAHIQAKLKYYHKLSA